MVMLMGQLKVIHPGGIVFGFEDVLSCEVMNRYSINSFHQE